MDTAYIGLGGNVPSWAGEPAATLRAAVLRMNGFTDPDPGPAIPAYGNANKHPLPKGVAGRDFPGMAQNTDRLGRVLRVSSLYRTTPVGYREQPDFINAVVVLQTALGPQALMHGLLQLEREFGRDRSHGVPNGPRTLDLDLLLMEDAQGRGMVVTIPDSAAKATTIAPAESGIHTPSHSGAPPEEGMNKVTGIDFNGDAAFPARHATRPALELPHPRIADRLFVLIPLAEVASQLLHPVLGQSVAQLQQRTSQADESAYVPVIRVEEDWMAVGPVGGAERQSRP